MVDQEKARSGSGRNFVSEGEQKISGTATGHNEADPRNFASIAVAKTQKSLVNTDFSGTPKATENRISTNVSKIWRMK